MFVLTQAKLGSGDPWILRNDSRATYSRDFIAYDSGKFLGHAFSDRKARLFGVGIQVGCRYLVRVGHDQQDHTMTQ